MTDGHISSGWCWKNMYFVYIIKKYLSIDWMKNNKKMLSFQTGCGIFLQTFMYVTCSFIIQSLLEIEMEAKWPPG
jgi:hypothetical protein